MELQSWNVMLTVEVIGYTFKWYNATLADFARLSLYKNWKIVDKL